MTRRRIVLTVVVLALLVIGSAAAPAVARAAGYTAGSLKMVTAGEDSFYNYDYDKGRRGRIPTRQAPVTTTGR